MLARPFVALADGLDGAISEDGQIAGTYLHGLFDTAAGCDALLAWAGLADGQAVDQYAIREAELERLADAVEAAIDLDWLLQAATLLVVLTLALPAALVAILLGAVALPLGVLAALVGQGDDARLGLIGTTSARRAPCSPPWWGRCWRSVARPCRGCSAIRWPILR